MDRMILLSFILSVFSVSSVVGIPKSGISKEEISLFFNSDSNNIDKPVTEGPKCVHLGLYKDSTIALKGKVIVSTGSTVDLYLRVLRAECANLQEHECTTADLCTANNPHYQVVAESYLNEAGNSFTFEHEDTMYFNSSKEFCQSLNSDSRPHKSNPSPDNSTALSSALVTTVENTSLPVVSPISKREAAQNTSSKDTEVAVHIKGMSGVYVVQVTAILHPSPDIKETQSANITLTFDMSNPHGHLDAIDFPALVFYGVMTGVYAIFTIAWLIVLGCNYTDLVRLQFWILAVIILGFVEKALFLAEFDSVNKGNELHMLIILAVVVSGIKRALSRMLLVIVALGYGIVKPRLGDSLARVIGAGVAYCILAVVHGILKAKAATAATTSTSVTLSYGLLVLLDAAIMFWIFSAIVETRRTLRIRKNLVKLAMYNHFSYALIFAVIATIGFVIWDIVTHFFPTEKCLKDWSEVWMQDCFWHVLFVIILAIIMMIWRPGANNKRFAYSLVDDEDRDEENEIEQGSNKNFESVKMRQVGGSLSEPPVPSSQAEDDLRWVEENLPTSAIDKALPLILDSDEELMTNKFESSKIN